MATHFDMRGGIPSLWRFETIPLGIDSLSTQQQDFVFQHAFPLDRIFALDYIAPSDSGDRDSTSGTPHSPREHRKVD
jgi:hypothetical protein